MKTPSIYDYEAIRGRVAELRATEAGLFARSGYLLADQGVLMIGVNFSFIRIPIKTEKPRFYGTRLKVRTPWMDGER